jgi:hypothetical protein
MPVDRVDTSLRGVRVVRQLEQLIRERGKPKITVSDNGTELSDRPREAFQRSNLKIRGFIALGIIGITPRFWDNSVFYQSRSCDYRPQNCDQPAFNRIERLVLQNGLSLLKTPKALKSLEFWDLPP